MENCIADIDEAGVYKCSFHGEFLSLGAVKLLLKKRYSDHWKDEWEKLKYRKKVTVSKIKK